jgi:hypothetical protein
MDGSSIDLIIIPIVASLSLAIWLIGMYYADSHPRWKHGPYGTSTPGAKYPAVAAPPQARADLSSRPGLVPRQEAAAAGVTVPDAADQAAPQAAVDPIGS